MKGHDIRGLYKTEREMRTNFGANSNDRALNIKEAGEFLGVSRSFMYRLMAEDRKFPKAAMVGSRKRFLLSDLVRYMETKSKSKP